VLEYAFKTTGVTRSRASRFLEGNYHTTKEKSDQEKGERQGEKRGKK